MANSSLWPPATLRVTEMPDYSGISGWKTELIDPFAAPNPAEPERAS